MNQQKRDDLTAIKGIGTVRQRWLADAFGVYTFADLAAILVDEVESVAREEGVILSRSKIENWIEQANELVASVSDSDMVEAADEATAITALVTEVQENGDIELDTKADVWKPIASFVVEFQELIYDGYPVERRTVVHHMEADVGNIWPGIEKSQLCQWIEQQANIEEIRKPAPPAILLEPDAVVAIQMTQARLLQAPDYSATLDLSDVDRPFIGHVAHGKPITLEVDFELSEPPLEAKRTPLEYEAHCQVVNLTRRRKTTFLDMKVISPADEDTSYKSTLPEILLEPGMYKLGIFISGKRPLGACYFELPKLNVL